MGGHYINMSKCIKDEHLAQDETETETGVGLKYDNQKLRYDLLPPHALEALVSVYTFGAQKYESNNYRLGINWSRVYAAVMRHLEAWRRGEDIDSESGLQHLAHATWGLFTLMEYNNIASYLDDRPYTWGEEYRKWPDFPAYEFSNYGNIRKEYTEATKKRHGKQYKPIALSDNGRKYKFVALWKNGVRQKTLYVHIAVATLFIRPPDDDYKEWVNHRDGNPENNNACNLEWVTPSGNLQDAYRRGTRKRVKPGKVTHNIDTDSPSPSIKLE